MFAAHLGVSLLCLANIIEKLRTEYAMGWRYRLEHHGLPNYFAPIRSHHFRRCYLSSLFADIEVRSSVYVDASFRQIYAALRIMRETGQKLIADSDHFMGVLAELCDSPRNLDILTFPKCPSKRVIRHRTRSRLMRWHDHSGVQPAGQSHPNPFMASKIERKVLRKNIPKSLVVSLRIQRRLLFPFARVKIFVFPL